MENTLNYNLKKPSEADEVLIGDFNDNSDIIDTELKKLDTEIKSLENNKVTKIEGKGLSSNDFTAGYLNKINNTENTLTTHTTDGGIHVTTTDKDKWDNLKSSQNFIRNGQFNISQRGYDHSEGKSYRVFADGWHTVNGVITTRIDGGIKLSQANTNLWCFQGFETKDVEIIRGNTVTASALVRYSGSSDVITMNIYSWQGNSSALPPGVGSARYRSSVPKRDTFDELKLTFNIPIDHNAMCININPDAGGTLEIKNVKLEIGDIATPYQPIQYGEELRACQRYYRETPFMVSGHREGDIVVYAHSNKMMRIEPRTNVKSLNTGVVGKVDLLNGIGSEAQVDPLVLMSNVGVTRSILALPQGSTGIQGILIEDAEIY